MPIRSRAITFWSAAASARTPRSAASSIATSRREDAPRTIERILKAYLAHRASREETFLDFARRHEIDALKAMTELEAAE